MMGARALIAALCVATALSVDLPFMDAIPHDKCGVFSFVNDMNELELYALGEDRSLLHKRQLCSGGWTKWTSMGGVFSSGPAVLLNNDAETEIFITGADKAIWHKKSTNRNSTEFTAFRSMGGRFSTGPSATTDSEGLIHVVVRGVDRALWHMMQKREADGTLSWGEWTSLGGTLTSSPQIILDNEGLLHVFARGMNRALIQKQTVVNETYFISWSPWMSLGGNLASAPKAVALSDSVGFLEIFSRAADKGLWRKRQVLDPDNVDEPIKWATWEGLGGSVSSGPASAVNSFGNLDLFARGTDKAIWHKQQIIVSEDGAEDWTQWESLAGIVSTSPSVAREEEGLVHVFVRGVDRSIWAKYQVRGANSTVTWTPWYSLGARTLKWNC
jgi:hypothetical protein